MTDSHRAISDDIKDQKAQSSKKQSDEAQAKLAAEANPIQAPRIGLTLTSSDLVQTENKPFFSTDAKKGIANFVGTMSASITGTMAWSIADKALGSTRYGLAAKLAASVLVGGSTRFVTKGTTELLTLDSQDRTTGLSDLAWGGVDALAAVGAVKTEQAFSNAWKTSLGRSSGAHLSQELMLEQGSKILQGDLGKRITHNTLRGMIGGGTGAFLWTTPHELVQNFDKLDTLDGWVKSGKNIGVSTAFGSVFGGTLFGGGTAVWNARELAGLTKAAVFGKQGRYQLDVYHFNDGHSSVLGDRSTLPQLASKAEELRAASAKSGTSSFVADLGDAHSGNAAAKVSNTGELEQRLIHQHLKVDASIPGNHSADTGLSGNSRDVGQWIRNMNTINAELQAGGREVPGLASNVQSVLDPQFASSQGVYKPFKIFVDPKTGDKVGMVALVTDQLQGATPKLLDGDLAVAAAKYVKLSFAELADQAASDPASKALVGKLEANQALQKLVQANPQEKLNVLVDQLVQKQYLEGLSPQAQQSFKSWFALAGEHPQAKLGDLAAQVQGNKALSDIAALYPEKRISDLHQVMVSDPLQALRDSVKSLEAQGVNKVVVLSHLGKSTDLQLAQEGPRVAAFFGGHSHDLEPRPLFVSNQATGSDVLVSQAGNAYGWLGEAKLVFNQDGSINRFLSSGKMHVIDESVPAMKSAKDYVTQHMSSSPAGQDLLRQVGERHPVNVSTEIPLDNIRGQQGTQTPLANLLVNAFKEGGDKSLQGINAERAAQNLPQFGNTIDAVLIQSGGIRAGLPAGPLDELTVQTMFMNKPSVIEMSGTEIQKALSYGVHDFPSAQPTPSILGKTIDLLSSFGRESSPLSHFDASGKNIIAGQLRFNIDRSLPTYARAQSVEIWDKAANSYVPLDPAKRYTVMTVNHLIGRFGNTPLIPAAQARSMSLDALGPEYWVFGKRLEPSALASFAKTSDLPATSSRDFLLDYLRANSDAKGRFVMPPSLLKSPMKDMSPGAWVPGLRPSPVSTTTLGAISVADKNKK